MPESAKQYEVAIWADASSVELARAVMGRMPELKATAVGGHRRTGLSELAEAVDAPVVDDLRRMLMDQPPHFVLLASAAGVTSDEMRQARKAGATVLALEPMLTVDDAEEEAAAQDPTAPPLPVLGWWWRQSPAWLAAAEPQQALGPVRVANVVSLAPAYTASLLARLLDAMDMLVALLGLPESVDAALTGVLSEPPEELRGLTGHMTAHLRFAEGANASLVVSDRAATWQRRLTTLGADAQLELGDVGYRLHKLDGKVIDAVEGLDDQLDAVDLLVQQWRRIISGGIIPKRSDHRGVVACCRAALLSCRTGELESPGTLLRMSG